MQAGQAPARRGRITRSQWSALVARSEHERARSGMTAHAFSAREGISVASLYRWRALVAGTTGEQARSAAPMPMSMPMSAPTPNNAHAPSAQAGFIGLGGLLGGDAPLTLRLELGAGIVLQLSRG